MADTNQGTNGGGTPAAGDPGVGIGSAPPPSGSPLGGPPQDTTTVDPAAKPAGGAPASGEPGKGGAPAAPAPGEPGKSGTPAVKPAAKAPTIADGAPEPKPGEKTAEPSPQTWPDDWRAKLAGDNKKAIDKVSRFKSPTDLLNSYMALETKLSSGEFAKKLPTHYTEEELAEYRKANNIPDDPKGYDLNVQGLVWGEADKPMLESWAQFAFDNHLPPELAKLGPLWYAREQENLVDRLNQQDQDNYQTGTAALQAEWGKEFKPNLNAAKNLFEGYPGVWEQVMGARNADGLKNGDNPVVLKAFAQIAREMNPFATVAPNVPGDVAAKSIDARLGELNAMMADKSGPYWKGSQSAGLQQEWRDLFDKKQQFEARGKAA